MEKSGPKKASNTNKSASAALTAAQRGIIKTFLTLFLLTSVLGVLIVLFRPNGLYPGLAPELAQELQTRLARVPLHKLLGPPPPKNIYAPRPLFPPATGMSPPTHLSPAPPPDGDLCVQKIPTNKPRVLSSRSTQL